MPEKGRRNIFTGSDIEETFGVVQISMESPLIRMLTPTINVWVGKVLTQQEVDLLNLSTHYYIEIQGDSGGKRIYHFGSITTLPED